MARLGDGDAVSLRLSADPRYLCLVRAMVSSFGALSGFDEDVTHRITLAVDEGCTNIIRHAYGGSSQGEIEVCCSTEPAAGGGRQLVVRLVDQGLPVDCTRLPEDGPPDPLTPGGLGLKFMRDIMDDVRFTTSEDGRNLLEMRLACPPAAPRRAPP